MTIKKIYLSLGLYEKPAAVKREYPALQNMKFPRFFYFCGIQPTADPDPQNCGNWLSNTFFQFQTQFFFRMNQCCGSASLSCGSGFKLSSWCRSGCGSGFLFDADSDPDPTFHPHADPEPHHESELRFKKIILTVEIGVWRNSDDACNVASFLPKLKSIAGKDRRNYRNCVLIRLLAPAPPALLQDSVKHRWKIAGIHL